VICWLHQRLAEPEITWWFELVESVTAAPHQYRRRETLIDEMCTLVRSADLEQPLSSFAGSSPHCGSPPDPFSASDRRTLHLQIAADCTDVARLSLGGPATVLLQAARRHQRQAEWRTTQATIHAD
jgi:hypothetical protein